MFCFTQRNMIWFWYKNAKVLQNVLINRCTMQHRSWSKTVKLTFCISFPLKADCCFYYFICPELGVLRGRVDPPVPCWLRTIVQVWPKALCFDILIKTFWRHETWTEVLYQSLTHYCKPGKLHWGAIHLGVFTIFGMQTFNLTQDLNLWCGF